MSLSSLGSSSAATSVLRHSSSPSSLLPNTGNKPSKFQIALSNVLQDAVERYTASGRRTKLSKGGISSSIGGSRSGANIHSVDADAADDDGFTILHIGSLSPVVRSALMDLSRRNSTVMLESNDDDHREMSPLPPLTWSVGLYRTKKPKMSSDRLLLESSSRMSTRTNPSGAGGERTALAGRALDRVTRNCFAHLEGYTATTSNDNSSSSTSKFELLPGDHCVDVEAVKEDPSLLFSQLLGQSKPQPCVDLLVLDTLGFNSSGAGGISSQNASSSFSYLHDSRKGAPVITGRHYFNTVRTAEDTLRIVAPLLKVGSSFVGCWFHQKRETNSAVSYAPGNPPESTELTSKGAGVFQGVQSAYHSSQVVLNEPIQWKAPGEESQSSELVSSGVSTEVRGLQRTLVAAQNFGSTALQASTRSSLKKNLPILAEERMTSLERRADQLAQALAGGGADYLGKVQLAPSSVRASARGKEMMLKRSSRPAVMSYTRMVRKPSFMNETSPPPSVRVSGDLSADSWLETGQLSSSSGGGGGALSRNQKEQRLQSAIRYERMKAATRVSEATLKWKKEVKAHSLREAPDPKKQRAVGLKMLHGHKKIY